MFLGKEYLEGCKRTVLANFENKPYVVGPVNVQGRVKRLLSFINKHRLEHSRILDVGSGGFLPVYLHATDAVDVTYASRDLLRSMGWKGDFKLASCDELPYKDKQFDIAICTEVIEHLPELGTVRETFKELERVARRWVVTTPCASRSGLRDTWNIEGTHRQFLTFNDVLNMVAELFPDLYSEDLIKLERVEHYVFVLRV